MLKQVLELNTQGGDCLVEMRVSFGKGDWENMGCGGVAADLCKGGGIGESDGCRLRGKKLGEGVEIRCCTLCILHPFT